MTQELEKYGEWMSTNDAPEYLEIGEASIYKLFQRNDFPAIRIGKLFKIQTVRFAE